MNNKRTSAFDPVKQDEDGKRARRVVWSSESLNLALSGIEQGRKLIANPFYDGNTKLLKGDLVFERTEEEVNEWLRCRDDIIYFASKYCKLMTPQGIQNIQLRDYQEEYLKHLIKNRLSIFLSCRQAGKTTTSAIFMLHYILFNFDKMALILGNKGETAKEILKKLKAIFNELPYFLKPGIYKWNETEISMDNGCRCKSTATTSKSGISYTCHCVLADEFAHIQKNIQEEFYNNLFPVISAAKARFIISSTQNGHNLFESLYKAAEAGESEYAAFKVDWYQVPEWDEETLTWKQRDENWHRMQIANMGGSEIAFNQQFGTNFDGISNTLISSPILSERSKNIHHFINNKDLPGCPHPELWFWKPGFDPDEGLRNGFFIITCDLSEGLGRDYTVFSVHKLLPKNCLEHVGYFRSNALELSKCAECLVYVISLLCNNLRILISIEWNSYGEVFLNDIDNLVNKYPEMFRNWDSGNIVKYYNDTNKTSFKLGIRLNSNNKTLFCVRFKNSYEKGEYSTTDYQTYNELACFEDTGNGSNHFSASHGNDDIVMTLIQTECVKQSLQYKLFADEFEIWRTGGECANNNNLNLTSLFSPCYYNERYDDRDFHNFYSDRLHKLNR